MVEIAEAVSEAVEKGRESRLNAVVATLVAVTATFMALCNVKDGNIVQAMQQAQAKSIDDWSFYQAKSMKQHMAEQMIDQLGFERDAMGNLTAEGRALLDRRIVDYTAQIGRYEHEKAEAKKQAEGDQKQYDDLNFRDDQFDMAEAACSISISVFGVTALTQKRWLLIVGLVFVGFGTLLGLAGFLGLKIHPDFLARILS